jgi:hypothetical protein
VKNEQKLDNVRTVSFIGENSFPHEPFRCASTGPTLTAYNAPTDLLMEGSGGFDTRAATGSVHHRPGTWQSKREETLH